MLTRKTTRIEPSGRGWVIRTGTKASGLYRTQKIAVDAARRMMKRNSIQELIVHGRDGAVRRRLTCVLPAVQEPPVKATLGAKAIEDAVMSVLRQRQG
jgi:hypothetical protein